MTDCESNQAEVRLEHSGKKRMTWWSAVRMSKSLPDSTNPLVHEVLPPVINCLTNMQKRLR